MHSDNSATMSGVAPTCSDIGDMMAANSIFFTVNGERISGLVSIRHDVHCEPCGVYSGLDEIQTKRSNVQKGRAY